ncbi:MAG TPA: glycosyltransferase [Actinomycetota bacterium]|nr:glycosyltransferase [Actinomycetota bacterium]
MLPIVPVQVKRASDYAEAAGDEAVERLRAVAESLRGLRVLHVSSTAFGGGVAELLHTQVPLMNDLGVEATWALIEGSDAFFAVTKAIHNALQGAETQIDDEMRATYVDRIRENVPELPSAYDVVIVHDPQPAAILQMLEETDARKGRWIWRCHIDLSAPYHPVWEFLEPVVNRYDAAIFTAEEYVQPGVTEPVRAFIPPSIDPLSPKNAPMSQGAWRAVIEPFGVDPDRPLVTQVSRFDPWKDPLGVIDAFRLVRKEVPAAQLVMAGSLAHDDPEGIRYLDLTNEHAAGDPDIYLFTDLDGVGDTAVNAFQRASDVVVQKSLREGFGLVVAEGMWKGKPVVGGDVGGIRLQIEEGVTGYLVDGIVACADRVTELLLEPERRRVMGETGRERARERFLCLRELEDTFRLITDLERGE